METEEGMEYCDWCGKMHHAGSPKHKSHKKRLQRFFNRESDEVLITETYLQNHPNHIFVFGDNQQRVGEAGGASLRRLSNAYGFITKKRPSNDPDAFFMPDEYVSVFNGEFASLRKLIKDNPDKLFLISKVGSGLANKYRIWEHIIKKHIVKLKQFPNVKLLFSEDDEDDDA